MGNHPGAEIFLMANREPGDHLTVLGNVPMFRAVKVATQHPDGGIPEIHRGFITALDLRPTALCVTILFEEGSHLSEFPLDYPCLVAPQKGEDVEDLERAQAHWGSKLKILRALREAR